MNTQLSHAPRHTTIAIVIIVVTWAMSLLALPWVPDIIPSHWGINGQPDAYTNKFAGLLLLPAIMSLLAVLMHFIPRFDPKQANYASFGGAYGFIQLVILLFLATFQGAIISIALGWSIDMSLLATLLVGFLFTGMGNVMGKLRPNWFVGIRTPWTLNSPDVWTRTHRLGGLLMVAIGILLIVSSPLLSAPLRLSMLLGSVFLWAFFTIGYSYWLWRKLV